MKTTTAIVHEQQKVFVGDKVMIMNARPHIKWDGTDDWYEMFRGRVLAVKKASRRGTASTTWICTVRLDSFSTPEDHNHKRLKVLEFGSGRYVEGELVHEQQPRFN
jgi:hypothetical protein